MEKLIIGISGKKRSGKTTIAEFIKEMYPDKVEIMSFADPVKKCAAIALGYPLTHFFYDENKKIEYEVSPGHLLSGREILQQVGTDLFRRHFDADIWVYTLLRRSSFSGAKIIVIPDVRFPNEANIIRAEGGWLLRVERPELEGGDEHISETALDTYNFDFLLNNYDGNKENMLEHVRRIVNDIVSTDLPGKFSK